MAVVAVQPDPLSVVQPPTMYILAGVVALLAGFARMKALAYATLVAPVPVSELLLHVPGTPLLPIDEAKMVLPSVVLFVNPPTRYIFPYATVTAAPARAVGRLVVVLHHPLLSDEPVGHVALFGVYSTKLPLEVREVK